MHAPGDVSFRLSRAYWPDVELRDERIGRRLLPETHVVVQRRNGRPLRLLGFSESEIEIYSELLRRWSASR